MDSRLITMLKDDPLVLEQYRNICAKIFLACGSPEKNCLLITSAVAAEGKSLNALNLAITIAQGTKKKVMLMDADLRNPTLPTLLSIKPDYGLTDYFQYLAKFVNKEDVLLERVICQSGIDRLSLIFAGETNPNPAEILTSKGMPELIAELKRRQKDGYLIIDSPPLIPTSDPIILSQYVDWIILVVQAGKTPRKIVRKAVDLLKTEKILGVILNNLELIPYEYSYGYKPYRYKTAKRS